MFERRHNPKTGKTEYALVSVKNPSKVLKYFGTDKPSDEEVEKEERRVNYFKHRKKTLVTS